MSEEQEEEKLIREMQELRHQAYELFSKYKIGAVLTVCVGGIERTVRQCADPDKVRAGVIQTLIQASTMELDEEG